MDCSGGKLQNDSPVSKMTPGDEYTGESQLPSVEYTRESRLPGDEYTGES